MSTDTAPRTKQRNFRLPVELGERLDAKAAELDVNAVDIVVEGLERELRRLGRGGELKLIAVAKPSKRRRHRRSEEASGSASVTGRAAEETGPQGSAPASPRAAEVRRSGEASLGRAPSEGAVAGDSRPAASPRDAVHLPTVLGGWTGMPTSIMRREIAHGNVSVGGEVCREPYLASVDRGQVRWNGRPV